MGAEPGTLQLNLLGGFSAKLGGEVLAIPSKKAQALLAVVSLSPEGNETRERLRGLLWSESSEKKAQYSLRNIVWSLRSAFEAVGFDGLTANRTRISLDSQRVTTDVGRIVQTLGSNEPDPQLCDDTAVFQSFLYGFDGADQAFDEWLRFTRERLDRDLVRKFEQALRAPGREPQDWLSVSKILVDHDATNEFACQELIRAYQATGATANALNVYECLWKALDEAFGEEPSPATQDLIVSIRTDLERTRLSIDLDTVRALQGGQGGASSNTQVVNGNSAIEPKAGETGSRKPYSLLLPDRPSIAVLAFENRSSDPEQEFFAEAVTEDIIVMLSKFRWFFVVARNSSFAYRGRTSSPQQIGLELGVRYVISGSIRRVRNNVRLSVQLVDASSGVSIWAERYDREIDDIFELQDEITLTIASAVEPELAEFERQRASKTQTEDLRAWDHFHRGVSQIWEMNRKSLNEGEAHLLAAIDADPQFGQPYGYLAFKEFLGFLFGATEDVDDRYDKGMSYARKALALDQRDYFAYFAKGRLHTMVGEHTAAIRELQTSIEINPSFVHGYFGLGTAHVYAGNGKEAIRHVNKAIRLSPHDPLTWVFLHYKGNAYTLLGEYDRAIDCFEQAGRYSNAQYWTFTELAAAYFEAGDMQGAASALMRARDREPNLSLEMLQGPIQAMNFTYGTSILQTLRKLGLE